MSSTATTICKTFSSTLLAVLLLAPPTLLADRWQSSNNPGRLHGEVKPKMQTTTEKKKPITGSVLKTREHVLLRGQKSKGSRHRPRTKTTAKKKRGKTNHSSSHQLGPDNIQRKNIR